MYLIGFDPGKDKCGIALIEVLPANYQVLFQEVVEANASLAVLEQLRVDYGFTELILGNQTLSKSWRRRISDRMTDLNIITVDERSSSQQARQRYWDLYPARGCQRLVPRGMRTPPRPIDDIVALILLERYLAEYGGE
ncbi:MAG: resolvase [Pseudanabaenaceae cyanobacterium]|jgi:RNase H-fold protein (predicted Holliday junction resolvase)